MRSSALLACVLLGLASVATGAAAQGYPNKPIRIVAATAPGGITDILARIVSDKVGRAVGQNFIVEIKPGAGGQIGADTAAKAPADGYTFLFVNVGIIAIGPWLQKDVTYDPIKDLDPVAVVADAPSIVTVNAQLPAATLREFIDYARKIPGKLNYGSSGVGTIPHLAGDLFGRMTGIEMVHVPYRGMALATVDLASGQIQAGFIALGTMRSQVAAGQVRMLAVASPARLASAPDVPTFDEAGLHGYDVTNWFGILAPAGTPMEAKALINRQVQILLDDPEVLKRLQEGGMRPMKESVEQFTARVRTDHAKWRDIVRNAGIKPE